MSNPLTFPTAFAWPPSPGPITQIQPFTYEDGITYVEILYSLKKYILEKIVPVVNNISDEFTKAILELIAVIDAKLAEQNEQVQQEIADMITYVNNAIDQIINNSIQVQDPVVAALMSDNASQTRGAGDKVYPIYRQWNVATASYPVRVPGAKNVFFGPVDPGTRMSGDDYWISSKNGLPDIGGFMANGWRLKRVWKLLVDRVLSGAGPAKILCIGDSTTWGTGSSGTYSNDKSWPSEMARDMVSMLAPTIYGLSIPPSDNRPDSDPRWTLGTGWARATENGVGLGGRQTAYKAGPGSGVLNFKPGFSANRYDVYYTINNNSNVGGTMTLSAGGTAVVVNTYQAGSNRVGKVTVEGPTSAAIGINIENTGATGNVWIIGIEPYMEGESRFRVGNAGVAASSTTTWLAGTGAWNVLGFLPVYDPDLVIIDLGINDAPANSAEGVVSRIKTIADAAAATGAAVLIKTMIPSQGERGDVEKTYVAEMRSVLAGTYPILDIFNYYGSWDRTNAMGLMFDWGHGNDYMYDDEGYRVAETLFRYSA